MDSYDTISSNNSNISDKHLFADTANYLFVFDVLGGLGLLKILQVTSICTHPSETPVKSTLSEHDLYKYNIFMYR